MTWNLFIVDDLYALRFTFTFAYSFRFIPFLRSSREERRGDEIIVRSTMYVVRYVLRYVLRYVYMYVYMYVKDFFFTCVR